MKGNEQSLLKIKQPKKIGAYRVCRASLIANFLSSLLNESRAFRKKEDSTSYLRMRVYLSY